MWPSTPTRARVPRRPRRRLRPCRRLRRPRPALPRRPAELARYPTPPAARPRRLPPLTRGPHPSRLRRHPSRSPAPRPWSGPSSASGSTPSSAFPARSCPRLTRSWTPPRCATSLSVTSRAPGMPPRGMRRRPGRVGVCMATSGPGRPTSSPPSPTPTTDSMPIVAITGQVSSKAIGTDAFQEADIRGITMPITKHNYLVTRASEIARALAEAFHVAATDDPDRCSSTSARTPCRAPRPSPGHRRSSCWLPSRDPATASRSARRPGSSPPRSARCSMSAAA